MQRTKSNFTEKAFLLSTYCEFSKRSRLFIDSLNSNAFVNFSVFLGDPSETHFHPTSQSRRRNPSPKESKRKKSSKKIQRDNERAAQFQAASGEPPPSTSSPAESSGKDASVNFSVESPAAEELTNNAMEDVSAQSREPPTTTGGSANEEIVRERHSRVRTNGVGNLNGMRPTSTGLVYPSLMTGLRLNSTDLFCAVKSQKCLSDQNFQSRVALRDYRGLGVGHS